MERERERVHYIISCCVVVPHVAPGSPPAALATADRSAGLRAEVLADGHINEYIDSCVWISMNVHMCIYIYREREIYKEKGREGERERDCCWHSSTCRSAR